MHSTFKSMLLRAAQTLQCLSLALLPALASEARAASHPPHATHPRPSALAAARRVSVPYLALIGSPGLNLAPRVTPNGDEPRLPEKPKPEPAPVLAPETQPEPTPTPVDNVAPAVPEPAPVETAPVEVTPTPVVQPQSTGRPISILPDDTLREVNPEEVLPYFQYPGGVPEPSRPSTPEALPPSSATYQVK